MNIVVCICIYIYIHTIGLAYAGWKMPKQVGTLSANLPDKPDDLSHSNRDHDPILLGHSLPVIQDGAPQL